MPKIHTPLPADKPGFHGEYVLGQKLVGLGDLDSLELWFNVELISVREIDVILYDPSFGLFMAETKGDTIKYVDKTLVLDAISQCKRASYSLRNAYQRHKSTEKPPFIQLALFFPLIAESEWTTSFQNDVVMLECAGSFVFSNHLDSSNALLRRFEALHQTPLSSVITPFKARRGTPEAELFVNYLNKALTQHSLKTGQLLSSNFSLSTLQELGETIVSKLQRSALITGLEGAGKTTLLKFIGLALARKGLDVAFLTQTIAAAMQAQSEIQAERAVGEFKGSFSAFYPEDFDRLLTTKTEGADAQIGPYIYDAVLVDDIQDLAGRYDGALNLIRSCTNDESVLVGAKNLFASLWVTGPERQQELEAIFLDEGNNQYVLEEREHYAPEILSLLDAVARPLEGPDEAQSTSQNSKPTCIRVIPEPNTWNQALLAEFLTGEFDSSVINNEPSLLVIFDTYDWYEPGSQYQQYLAAAHKARIPVHDLVPQGDSRKLEKAPGSIIFTHYKYLQGLHSRNAIIVNPLAIHTNWSTRSVAGPSWVNYMRYALTRATHRLTMSIPRGDEALTQRLLGGNYQRLWGF